MRKFQQDRGLPRYLIFLLVCTLLVDHPLLGGCIIEGVTPWGILFVIPLLANQDMTAMLNQKNLNPLPANSLVTSERSSCCSCLQPRPSTPQSASQAPKLGENGCWISNCTFD